MKALNQHRGLVVLFVGVVLSLCLTQNLQAERRDEKVEIFSNSNAQVLVFPSMIDVYPNKTVFLTTDLVRTDLQCETPGDCLKNVDQEEFKWSANDLQSSFCVAEPLAKRCKGNFYAVESGVNYHVPAGAKEDITLLVEHRESGLFDSILLRVHPMPVVTPPSTPQVKPRPIPVQPKPSPVLIIMCTPKNPTGMVPPVPMPPPPAIGTGESALDCN